MRYPCGFTLTGNTSEFPLPANSLVELAHTTYESAGAFTVDGLELSMDDDVALEKTLVLESLGPGDFAVPCIGDDCWKPNLVYANLSVIPAAEFDAWYVAKCRKANLRTIKVGKEVHKNFCIACHSVNDSRKVGPSVKDLACTERQTNKGTVFANDAFLLESMLEPNKKLSKGYPPAMPPMGFLTEGQLQSVILYMKSISQFCGAVEEPPPDETPPPRFPEGQAARTYDSLEPPRHGARLTEVSPDIGDHRTAFLATARLDLQNGKLNFKGAEFNRHLRALPGASPSEEFITGARHLSGGVEDNLLLYLWLLGFVERLDAELGKAWRQKTIHPLLDSLESAREKAANGQTCPSTAGAMVVIKATASIEAFRTANNRAPLDLDEAGVAPDEQYDVSYDPTEEGFIVRANGKGKRKGDGWSINERLVLAHEVVSPCGE